MGACVGYACTKATCKPLELLKTLLFEVVQLHSDHVCLPAPFIRRRIYSPVVWMQFSRRPPQYDPRNSPGTAPATQVLLNGRTLFADSQLESLKLAKKKSEK